MIIVGITGPTGAGKTVACETLTKLGAGVINADRVARAVTEKGSPVLAELAECFGSDILNGGELDRKELARRAFVDAESTEKLNSVIFPYIIKRISEEIQSVGSSANVVVLDAPTLFESGCDSLCDVTVAVLADAKHRLPRILHRDGLSETDADLRMSAGKTDDFYISRVDHVVVNDGTVQQLREKTECLYNQIINDFKEKLV